MTPCKVILDGWRDDLARWVWSDDRAKRLRKAFLSLARYLAALVDRPDEVRLVIAINLSEAVQARSDHGGTYDIARGSGLVGGRTMAVDDGIDVVIDGGFLVDIGSGGTPIPNVAGVELVRRTLAHEAQHVVMTQRGSGFEAYDRARVDGWIGVHVFDIAAKMCDEHRAEWNAIQLTEPDPPTTTDVLDVLEAFGQELSEVNDAYQSSLDVRSLMEGVLKVCANPLTAVAYWMAQYRHGDVIDSAPSEFASLRLWDRYIGQSWDEIAQALSQLPVTDLSTSSTVLHAAARDLADLLNRALQHIGFDYTDGSTPTFTIRRFDFPSIRQ